LTNDPLEFAAGDVNTYRFVGNEPECGLDPLGLDEKGRVWSVEINSPQLVKDRTIKYRDQVITIQVGADETIKFKNGQSDSGLIVFSGESDKPLPDVNWLQMVKRKRPFKKGLGHDSFGSPRNGITWIINFDEWVVDTDVPAGRPPFYGNNDNQIKNPNNSCQPQLFAFPGISVQLFAGSPKGHDQICSPPSTRTSRAASPTRSSPSDWDPISCGTSSPSNSIVLDSATTPSPNPLSISSFVPPTGCYARPATSAWDA